MLPTLTRAHLVLVCFGLCLLTACDDSSASLDQDIDITRDDGGHGGNAGAKGGKGGGGGSGGTAKGGAGGSNASSGKPSGGSGGAGGASAGSGGAAAIGGSSGASAGASGARAGAGGAAGRAGAGTGGRSGIAGSSVSVAGASGHAVAGSGGIASIAGAGAAGHAGAAGMSGGGGSGVVRSGPCASCESSSIATGCPESLSDCSTLTGTTDANSPMPGVPKAALCQTILDCFHMTHCAANFTPTDCLCGAGVAADACMMSKDFAGAKGTCKDLMSAGAETTDMAMIQDRMMGKMYALGPAVAVLLNCDYNSCTKECL